MAVSSKAVLSEAVQQDLSALLQREAFQESPLEQYRVKLAKELQNVLIACSKTSALGVTRYDGTKLRECLLLAIPWKRICRDFDNFKESALCHDASVLEEVLACLQTPSIWPSACTATTALLDVLLSSAEDGNGRRHKHRLQWPSSQQKLLQFVTLQLRRHPALLSQAADGLLRNLADHETLGATSRALSILKLWTQEFPSHLMGFCTAMLHILVTLQALETRHQADLTRKVRTSGIREQVETCKKRKSCFRSSDHNRLQKYLHGELEEDEESFFAEKLKRRSSRSHRTSRKEIARATNEEDPTDERNRLLVLWELQAKCVKVFLSTSRNVPATLSLLRRILDLIKRYPQCPSLRLCAILLVGDQEEPRSQSLYITLAHMVFSRALTSTESRSDFLRFYGELLTEFSHFDDPGCLWKTLGPYLEHLNTLTQKEIDRNEVPTTEIQPFLQCFAYVMSRRGTMLQRSGELTSLLAHLSHWFEQSSDWLHPATPADERNKILRTLQVAGVLGLCDSLDGETSESDLSFTCSAPRRKTFDSVSSLPFPLVNSHSDSLCSTVRRMSLWIPELVNARRLFSQGTATGAFSTIPAALKPIRPCNPVPIMEYLNGDLVGHVFSFLGHKRLLQMRVVCQSWKTAADSKSLWRGLYKSRFGFQQDDPTVNAETLSWKQIFLDLLHAEKNIRFRLCTTDPSWKLRTCAYVGCLQVMTSPKQWGKHLAKHRRDNEKKKKRKKMAQAGRFNRPKKRLRTANQKSTNK